MKETAEGIINRRLGTVEGGMLVRELDRKGFRIVGKVEHLRLVRAEKKLAKLNGK